MSRHRFVNNMIFYLLTEKDSLDVSLSKESFKTKTPSTEKHFCQGRIEPIRGATLLRGHDSRALDGVPAYSRQLTYAHTSQNTRPKSLTAPSAVHLTTCFSPDSQHHGFSVEASLPLSPHQRFGVFTFVRRSIAPRIFIVNHFSDHKIDAFFPIFFKKLIISCRCNIYFLLLFIQSH